MSALTRNSVMTALAAAIESVPGAGLADALESVREIVSALYDERDALVEHCAHLDARCGELDAMRLTEAKCGLALVTGLVAAERDQLRERREGEWQPIAEAPRDGTFILVLVQYGDNPAIAQFRNNAWHACTEYVETSCGSYCYGGPPSTGIGFTPTHWVPIPAPRVGDTANLIATVDFVPRSNREANARLIAAAPDLLEALIALSRTFSGERDQDERDGLAERADFAAMDVSDVADSHVESVCAAYWPHWNLAGYYNNNSKDQKRKRMRAALETALRDNIAAATSGEWVNDERDQNEIDADHGRAEAMARLAIAKATGEGA